MADITKGNITVRGVYRSHSHLPIWEVIEKAHIWEQVGIEPTQLEYCESPPDAEAALFDGSIDFISGNHLTPYVLVAEGKPIVSIASPVNATTATITSTQPIKSVLDLRGKRVADTPLEGRDGGFHHGRGNHMMYIIRSGMRLEEIKWVDVDGRKEQLEALRSGKADAAFAWASEETSKESGFHTITLDPLPMINGPTITTSLTTLEKKDGLGERLVKAQVLGIHYARTNREKTERILEDLNKRTGSSYKYSSLARMPMKPYPDPQGIINAYELGCMKSPKAKELSPLALWDLHYLRMLDHSGFIDRLYKGAGL